MNNKVKSEDRPSYSIKPNNATDDATIADALNILYSRLKKPGATIGDPQVTRNYLKLKLADKEEEVFCILFLDNKNCVIEYEEMFQGTIDGASVHPRVVVKHGLYHNAAAVILAHNHPSGDPEPSRTDILLTRRLVDALGLIDIRVLDHIVVGGTDTVSFAERGLV